MSTSSSSRIPTDREIVLELTLFMTLFYSIFMVVCGVTLYVDGPTNSSNSLVAFYIISGSVILFFASFLEFIYLSRYRSTSTDPKWLYWISIVVIFVMFLLNAVVIIVVNMNVVNRGGGSSSTGGDGLDDYSSWLRKTYAYDDGRRWNLTKDSLIRQNVCEDITRTVYGTIPSKDELRAMTSTFTSIQTGCCMPPIECNFHYVSPTVWNKPPATAPSSLENSDCKAWDSNPSTLCFNCDSCKAALLYNFKVTWKQLAHENAVLMLVLFVFYYVGIKCYIRSSPNGQAAAD